MIYNLITNIESCYIDIPSLLYYSHIPTAVLALLFAFFLLFNEKENKYATRVFFFICIVFATWVIVEGSIWLLYNSIHMMFLWSLLPLLHVLLHILSVYFVYTFLFKKDISFLNKILFIFLLSPVIFLLPTEYNIEGFDIENCQAIEGQYFISYRYFISVVTILWIIGMTCFKYIFKANKRRQQILTIPIGVILFLLLFSWTEISASLTENFEITQYGLFGMPVLLAILTYNIVKFKIFNIKLAGAQALVVSLWFLVGSLLFVAQSASTRIVAGITLLITTIAGYYLVKSVRKEIEQREQIEGLAQSLQVANERLKELDKMKSEFVSIASHQLRSPLTSIRGYASMLAEGSYGKIPDKASEVLGKIVDSAKFMAQSVEDYLNVSRIEAGNMKYELSDFDLRKTAETIVDELRQTAMKKGLVLVFRSECTGSTSIHADVGKTRQVLMNLIDNSIKYTPNGSITVVAHTNAKAKNMRITIEDTGIGMSKETLTEVFDKFVRAKNANNVNVTGTGLGLYVAKMMVEQMKGKVWAESDGEGRGSRFIVEFGVV